MISELSKTSKSWLITECVFYATYGRGKAEIEQLSLRLRQISFNFCLTAGHFAELLSVEQNSFFNPLVMAWFDLLKNTPKSTVVNGLELLIGLAITCKQGKLLEKSSLAFDIFDFDNSGLITKDELMILMKSAIRSLSKFTTGLGARLAILCPASQIEELARQCYAFCEIEECDDVSKSEFLRWIKNTPKVMNLIRCFVPKEKMSESEAAILIQRHCRGKLDRMQYAKLFIQRNAELENELDDAASKIQSAVTERKEYRNHLHKVKLDKNALSGAVLSFGSNKHSLLGNGSQKKSLEPQLLSYFRHNDIRIEYCSTNFLHSSAVTNDGHVFTWGVGAISGCGTTDIETNYDNYMKKVEDLEDVHIISSSLGNRHSLALTDDGIVLSWGSGIFGQVGHGLIELNNSEIDHRANQSAARHDLLASDIYKMHFDKYTGKDYPYIDLPLALDKSLFQEEKIIQISCGYYFSVALSEKGNVFTWGEGSDGQLGVDYSDSFQVGYLDEYIRRSNFTYISSPIRVEEIKEPIRQIAVGGNHVFAIARESLSVYEWGCWNKRCGEDTDAVFAPTKNEELGSLCVKVIATGKEHSLAICGKLGLSIKGFENIYALAAKYSFPLSYYASGCSASLVVENMSFNEAVYTLEEDIAEYRSSLENFVSGNGLYMDCGLSPGSWIRLFIFAETLQNSSDNRPENYIDFSCTAALSGPSSLDCSFGANFFLVPTTLKSLRHYIRPENISNKVVIYEFQIKDFQQDDECSDYDDEELFEKLVGYLLKKVYEAQDLDSLGIIIIFDFHDVEPFPIQQLDDGNLITIPVVMMSKIEGKKMLSFMEMQENQSLKVSFLTKKDTLYKKILAAQDQGATIVVVGQNEHHKIPCCLDLKPDIDGIKPVSEVNIPVVMISYNAGKRIKEKYNQLNLPLSIHISVESYGDVYAWGCGENGRLGLGDTEDYSIFETGYDGATDSSYQFSALPQLISYLIDKNITDISCGLDHSGAVTDDGDLYCWGCGTYGKLGNGCEDDENIPRKVEYKKKAIYKQVVCGDDHTIAVTHIGKRE